MKLSDGTLRKLVERGDIEFVPGLTDQQWQPCSVDLRLGTSFQSPGKPRLITSSYKLHPGEFVLGCTQERVRLGRAFMGQVEGRSTWARRGLQVHAAGLVDPGFDGELTLELVNLGSFPLALSAGERICQMTIERLDWPAVRPYGHAALGSKYQHQIGATSASEHE